MAIRTQKVSVGQDSTARAVVRAKCLKSFEDSLEVFGGIVRDPKSSTAEKLKALELIAKIAGLLQADGFAEAPVAKVLSLKGLSQAALDELDRLAIGPED
ncbi:MAG TPA: hypothetical protein VK171_01360 [Fimbriimonas sp.]|nr:hypothetical protein [Fimbriimonas sp.]